MTIRGYHSTLQRENEGAMKKTIFTLLVVAALSGAPGLRAAADTLEIYIIDVEGGQATLVVAPFGESLLIDTGFPSKGTFSSIPGDPKSARDAQRILAAAHDAGVTKIDYLMLTHYHADHAGGVVEVAGLLPIGLFIDHAAPTADADKGVAGTQAVYDAYASIRPKSRHFTPAPGDKLPVKLLGLMDTIVVATEDKVMSQPIPGATLSPSVCSGSGIAAQEKTENPRSTAVKVQWGRFSFLDVGDLSGPSLFALTCPNNLIGDTDVYLVAHHGGDDAADPAMYLTIKPLVAIVNNGERKGAQPETMATLARLGSTIDTWQLHRPADSATSTIAVDRIANLDDTTSAWIKISASKDGTFTVTNGRTGFVKTYKR